MMDGRVETKVGVVASNNRLMDRVGSETHRCEEDVIRRSKGKKAAPSPTAIKRVSNHRLQRIKSHHTAIPPFSDYFH